MDEQSYTTTQVTQITGFSARQLDYWARESIVIPSFQQSHGSGTRRLYSIDDLVQLQFIRRLKQHRCSTQKIRTAINTLRKVIDDPNPLRSAVLIYDQATLLALYKTKEGERVLLDTLNIGGQQVMGIVLETLKEETQHKVACFTDEVMTHE